VQVQQTHIKAKYLLGLTDERPGPALAANMTRYGMGQVLILDDTCCTRLHVANFFIWTALPFRLPGLCMQYAHSGCTLLWTMSPFVMQARGVRDYFAFANIDLAANISRAADKFCGNAPMEVNNLDNQCLRDFAVQWVPAKQKQY
jgi:hypothetical protein